MDHECSCNFTHVAVFQACNDSIHLTMDGCTAPIVASYLGIVVIWVDKGTLYHAVLEFARLKEGHLGKYLAKVIYECLECYNLSKFVC
ncbi:hypothetical protein PAXRUDRAFT_158408 [Paxillus rubicundulus Ve08.2h10]|uniref:Uncharacterized protein n=1 Tax=Paxillus rubicundulus Ve08.2h10 TaxID=930991 RepID=A0A0D0CCQ4_9AGAM|nr:hypothetical protein PAXRUDRAFT_158408 [Paxillus rubicundulus Ve08.2h10]